MKKNVNTMKIPKWILLFGALLASIALQPAPIQAQENASIKIVKPGDRRNVPLGENDVAVQIKGANLQDGYTWQLYFDGVPQGIVRGAMTSKLQVDNPNVLRRLKAVLYNPQGAKVAEHEILIVGVKKETHDDVFNRSWFVPAMLVFFGFIAALILLTLRIRLRHAT